MCFFVVSRSFFSSNQSGQAVKKKTQSAEKSTMLKYVNAIPDLNEHEHTHHTTVLDTPHIPTEVSKIVTEIGLFCLTFRLAASSETWELGSFHKSLTKPQGETLSKKYLFQ